MTISVVGLLIALIVVCVILYCARLILNAFAVPQPFATVIFVVLMLVCLIIILQASGLWWPYGTMRIQ